MDKVKSKGEQTRERIVLASVDLFAEKGFHQTSFQNIADIVGLRQTAIIRHYPSKQELLLGVIQHILLSNQQEVLGRMDMQMNAMERIEAYCQGNIQWAIKNPAQAKNILLIYYQATFEPTFTELNEKLLLSARQKMLEMLYAGEREQLFEFKAQTPEFTAQLVHELLMGIIVNIMTVGSKMSKRHVAIGLEKIRFVLERIRLH
jgi:AcrR family transcriptional regulator